MSRWTSVSSIINYSHPEELPINLDLGIMCREDDAPEVKDLSIVPRGSGDSLSYEVVTTNGERPRTVAMIWGALRDYDNLDEILQYLRFATRDYPVTAGIAHIEIDGRGSYLFRYEGNDWCQIQS